MRQRRLAVTSEQTAHGAHGQRRTEVHIPRESARPPLVQLAPVLAPVHPPAVQVKYNDIPLRTIKIQPTMAVSLFFYYCCPLNLMDQKKTGQDKFEGPHYFSD